MNTHSEQRRKERRLADLRSATEELERKLDSVRMSLAAVNSAAVHRGAGRRHHDVAATATTVRMRAPAADYGFDADGEFDWDAVLAADEADDRAEPRRGRRRTEPRPTQQRPTQQRPTQQRPTQQGRTEDLVSHGRRTSRPARRLLRKAAITGAVGIAVLILILVVTLSGGGASWPSSVATVQSEADRACQNPDVKSEPGQVNFACNKATRQVLWVFALLTSDDNPRFADPETGRVGLEPIGPDQGGEVAWSLNLHHPYNALNPTDSLEVAARAINSIIGGATVTSASGTPVVQPGLEGSAANCLRYTGSAALATHQGFPSLCAKPVSTPAGQAALVADVYQKWMVGATPQAAQDAAVLFQNANDPGNPQVQVILKQIRKSAS